MANRKEFYQDQKVMPADMLAFQDNMQLADTNAILDISGSGVVSGLTLVQSERLAEHEFTGLHNERLSVGDGDHARATLERFGVFRIEDGEAAVLVQFEAVAQAQIHRTRMNVEEHLRLRGLDFHSPRFNGLLDIRALELHKALRAIGPSPKKSELQWSRRATAVSEWASRSEERRV